MLQLAASAWLIMCCCSLQSLLGSYGAATGNDYWADAVMQQLAAASVHAAACSGCLAHTEAPQLAGFAWCTLWCWSLQDSVGSYCDAAACGVCCDAAACRSQHAAAARSMCLTYTVVLQLVEMLSAHCGAAVCRICLAHTVPLQPAVFASHILGCAACRSQCACCSLQRVLDTYCGAAPCRICFVHIVVLQFTGYA